MVCHGSPVYDLSYCLYSGGSTEIFDKLDDYLKIYHSSLANTLNEFGLEAEQLYSINTLKKEWKIYSKYGFAMGIMLWRIKLVDHNDVPDIQELNEIDENNTYRIASGKEEEFKQRIKALIFHMYKNDYF